ncbi:hypothetical protein, partial [Bacillus amyloliquefaciens]|uniref:hypothetical protein n=1 Tax=Bacillus amyloliquefaciens TaxID=1390 RepID=UPI00140490A9
VRITTLRNQLSQSGQSAQDRNQINAELERVGKESKRLRLQAQEAAGELKTLLAEGSQKGFKEAGGQNPTTDDGKPNEKYYRER